MPPGLSEFKNDKLPKRVIGLAGKKGSGKDASANFIAGINLVTHGYIEEFHSTRTGQIEIAGKPAIVNSIAPDFIKIYHFADALKELCHRIFGVDYKLLENYKHSNTRFKWQDMPGVVTNLEVYNAVQKFLEKKQELVGPHYTLPIMYHEPGLLTGRDLLQFIGTDIFRKIYNDCWIATLVNQILQESPKIAIIADVRFFNELNVIKEMNGLCVKLTRITKEDSHISENDFMQYKAWDAIIDNAACKDIRCLNQKLYEGLVGLGIYNEIKL